MRVGHGPFPGSSQVEIAMAQVKRQPPELPEVIGADLRRLVMMALAKAPANRPRSASAVARILEAIQRGVEPRFTTGAIPVSRVEGHDWTGESRTLPGSSVPAGSADAGADPGSAEDTDQRSRPGPSPTGSRTAATPLPLSGPSATSAASAASPPARPSVSGSAGSARSGPSAQSALSARSAQSAQSAQSASPAPSERSSRPARSATSPPRPRRRPEGAPS